jgi:molybdenum cofactor cytidylyltransferase
MGKPKLLLCWKRISLLEHVLHKTVVVPFKEVKVVLPKQDECIEKIVAQYAYTPIHNEEPHIGMGRSLAIAVQSLPLSAEAAIIFLGDQPTLSAKDISKQWFIFKRIRSKLACCPKIIIQMKYIDGRVGHPILFSYHFFEELRSLRGDIGGKDIIRKNSRFVFFCYSDNEYPDDIDTPDDYRQLLKMEGEDY